MSKFEINRITIELIRAILRFHFTSLAPLSKFDSIHNHFLTAAQRHFSLLAYYQVALYAPEFYSC